MISTAREAIKQLELQYKDNLDENLVITWWDSSDFKGMDLDQAYDIANDSLECVCIGHVNEWVSENVKWIDEEGER